MSGRASSKPRHKCEDWRIFSDLYNLCYGSFPSGKGTIASRATVASLRPASPHLPTYLLSLTGGPHPPVREVGGRSPGDARRSPTPHGSHPHPTCAPPSHPQPYKPMSPRRLDPHVSLTLLRRDPMMRCLSPTRPSNDPNIISMQRRSKGFGAAVGRARVWRCEVKQQRVSEKRKERAAERSESKVRGTSARGGDRRGDAETCLEQKRGEKVLLEEEGKPKEKAKIEEMRSMTWQNASLDKTPVSDPSPPSNPPFPSPSFPKRTGRGKEACRTSRWRVLPPLFCL